MNNPFASTEDAPDTSRRRAAHLLILATRLLGTSAQVRAVQVDARELQIPLVRRRSSRDDLDSLDRERQQHLFLPQERLDESTQETLSRLGVTRSWKGGPSTLEEQAALWSRIQTTRSRPATYALLNISARSDDTLLAVSAATALAEITKETSELSRSVLLAAADDPDPETAAIAKMAAGEALNTVNLSPSSSRIQASDAASGEREPSTTPQNDWRELSACIHGTWSRHPAKRWYAPQSRLHRHIKTNATPSLYDESDYFRWTGGYISAARSSAARDLSVWRARRGATEFDTIFAHSHGGNVALEAAARGERIHLLVLLHTPVAPRSTLEWTAVARNVGRILSLRSRADLVMIADGLRTGSTLDLPSSLLPGGSVKPHWNNRAAYFAHDFYLRLGTWNDFDIASDIAFERGLVP